MKQQFSWMPWVAGLMLGWAPWWIMPVQAKFLSPPEVVKGAGLAAMAKSMQQANSPESSKAAFEKIKSGAAADASGETWFFLGYLYQYGIGTTASVEQARIAYEKAAKAGLAAAVNNFCLLDVATGHDAPGALAHLTKSAEAGNTAAQCSLGQLYLKGIPDAGLPTDPAKARSWFEKASSGGDADASFTLAMMIISQAQISPDETRRTLTLMEKAVESGHLPAMVELGGRLLEGKGPPPDVPRGLAMLEKAAELGSTEAFMTLGNAWEGGAGVAIDHKKALQYYQKAAALGDFTAYSKIGYFHEKGMGVPASEEKAREAWQTGADKQVGLCLYNLAVLHDEGRAGLLKDPAAAFDLHYRAAMVAFVPSQLALGVRYRDGKGVPADPQAALAWFQRALQNGDRTAALNVAALLESGSTGVVDYQTAANLYKEAAAQGSPLAMASLAAMMEEGRSPKGDFKEVFLLYTAAAEGGVNAARDRLEQLRKRLSPEELQAAEAYVLANRRPAQGPPSATPDSPARGKPETPRSSPKPASPGKAASPQKR